MFTIKMIVRFFLNIYEETSISLILAISEYFKIIYSWVCKDATISGNYSK